MGGAETVGNKPFRRFWKESDIIQIIGTINNRPYDYVATTWKISFEISDSHNRKGNHTAEVRQHLLEMEESGLLKQGRDRSGNLIWELT
jgi:hypothetical protein